MEDKILTDTLGVLKVNVTKFKANIKPIILDIVAKGPMYPIHIMKPGPDTSVVHIMPLHVNPDEPKDVIYGSNSQFAEWVNGVSESLMDKEDIGMVHIIISRPGHSTHLLDIRVFDINGTSVNRAVTCCGPLGGGIIDPQVKCTIGVTHSEIPKMDD